MVPAYFAASAIKYSPGYILQGISSVAIVSEYVICQRESLLLHCLAGASGEGKVIRASEEFILDERACERFNSLTRWLPYNLRHFNGGGGYTRMLLRLSSPSSRSFYTAHAIPEFTRHAEIPRNLSPFVADLRAMYSLWRCCGILDIGDVYLKEIPSSRILKLCIIFMIRNYRNKG